MILIATYPFDSDDASLDREPSRGVVTSQSVLKRLIPDRRIT